MNQSNGNAGDGSLEALEQRVNRLESAVVAFQDTHQLENRLVERISERLSRRALMPVQPSALVVDSRRSLVSGVPVATPVRQRWLFFDVYQDARTIGRMFFDPNYRVSPGVGLMTAGLCVAFILSWFLSSTIPLVGFLVGRMVDLILLFVLFKVLTREAHRYRMVMHEASPLSHH